MSELTDRADALISRARSQEKTQSNDLLSRADALIAKAQPSEKKEDPASNNLSARADALIAKKSGQPQELPEEIGLGTQVASLGAEIVAGEAGRMGTTAAGAAIGTAFGGPVGTLVGGGIGFLAGGLGFGAAASYGAQTLIEGRDEVDKGRIVRDALINTIPILGKAGKGAKLGTRLVQSAAQQGAVGGAIGAGGAIVETRINEGRWASAEELAAPTLLGIGMGAGLGVTGELASKGYKKIAGMDQKQMREAILRGDPEVIALTNAVDEAAPKIAAKADLPWRKRVIDSIQDLTARQIPSWRLRGNLSQTLGDYNDSVARGQAQTLSKMVDAGLKAKTIAKRVTVSDAVGESGLRLNDKITIIPGEVLRKGTVKHDSLVTYMANRVMENNPEGFVDPITGKLLRQSVVGSNEHGQILRWRKGDAPAWLGDEALQSFAKAKSALRVGVREMLNLHHAKIRELDADTATKLAKSLNEDSYMPRTYKFFTQADWEPSNEAKRKLYSLLESPEVGMTHNQAKEFEVRLREKKALDPIDAMSELTGGRLSKMNVLKKRKLGDTEELDKVLREYLGEVRNPAERVGEGYMQVQKYIAETKASRKMAEHMFLSGEAKLVSGIPSEEVGAYVPLRVGGVEMRAEGVKQRSGMTVPNKLKATLADGGGVSASKAEKFGKVDPRGEVVMVPREFQQAINQMTGEGVKSITESWASNVFGKAFLKSIALSKFVKVPFNPPSYIIQGYGSIVSTFTNGYNPFSLKLLGKSKRVRRFSANPKSKDLIDAVKGIGVENILDLQRRGLLDRNTFSRDMNDILGSAERGASILEKGFQKIGDLYSFQDDLWRISNYFQNQGMVSKAVGKKLSLNGLKNPKMAQEFLHNGNLFSADEINEVAQFFTRQWYQNYSQLNRIGRDLSQLGVLGQFASFGMELARNYTNKFAAATKFASGQFVKDALRDKQMDLMARGMDAGDAKRLVDQLAPQMTQAFRTHGYKMLAGQALAFGGTATAISLWNAKHGIDESMEDSLREIVYPFDRNKNLAFDFDQSNGHLKWMNVSYLAETATYTNVVQSAARGDTPTERLLNVFGAIMSPIQGEGLPFILKNMGPVLGNYNPKVRKAISVSDNPLVNAIERSEWYVSETFMPGFVREYKRATSETYDQSKLDTGLRQVGLRWNSRSLDDLVKSRVVEISQLLNTSRSNLSYDLRRLPENMHEAAYQKHNAQYQENFQASLRLANSVSFIKKKVDPNFKRDGAIRVLREAGMPAKEALFAVKGETPSLTRTHTETPSDKWDEIYALPQNKRRAAIEAIEDNNMKRDVMRRYKKDLQDTRMGVTEEQKVLRTMRTEERANTIFEMMQESSNPNGLLQDLRRKRVVTQKVYEQIRTLQRAGG